jgi:glycine cleavage system H lipoate-binding protein
MGDAGSIDIFATKGIEYLIVVGYLIVLVGVWNLLTSSSDQREAARATRQRIARPSGWIELKDGFYFHQGHSWAVPVHGPAVRVGMDDFAQKLLGKPAAIELPDVGSSLKQGEPAWVVEVDSQRVDMLSPVDGEVTAVNRGVLDSPELVCGDPYGTGWLLEVRVPSPKRVFRNLLTGKLARMWMEATVEKVRSMRAGELGIVLPDGGFPVSGFARALSPDRWDEVAREFLLSD